MKKWLLRIFMVLAALFLAAFWQMYFSERPPLMTDQTTLAGDGSTINYCELPMLDSSGKRQVVATLIFLYLSWLSALNRYRRAPMIFVAYGLALKVGIPDM